MNFPAPIIYGRLIRRYKRFLADVLMPDGKVETIHCTNSGSMHSCIEEGAPVAMSYSDKPGRKTRYTWEMIFINNGWVGVNTMQPNRLAFHWISSDLIPGLTGMRSLQREVTFMDSRFDLMGTDDSGMCYIEVKNVSMREGNRALFPDAKTERGRKHLNTLMEVKRQGMRAVMLYMVQRMDVDSFSPAELIDPEYARALRMAHRAGVEIIVQQVKVSPDELTPAGILPFYL